MEPTQSEKKAKAATKVSNSGSLRVKNATKKAARSLLNQANKKDYGKRVSMDQLLSRSLSKLEAGDIRELQEQSLSHTDRLKRDYKAYVAKHGPIAWDEYLGLRVGGNQASQSTSETSQN